MASPTTAQIIICSHNGGPNNSSTSHAMGMIEKHNRNKTNTAAPSPTSCRPKGASQWAHFSTASTVNGLNNRPCRHTGQRGFRQKVISSEKDIFVCAKILWAGEGHLLRP